MAKHKILFKRDFLLSKLSNIKCGGKANFFIEVRNLEDLMDAISEWENNKKKMGKLFIIAGGTNILFSDLGYKGTIIKISFDKIKSVDKEIVFAEAGVLMSELVKYCFKKKLSGLEWACGLPGTFGGAIRGNAGAFGGEIKDNILGVLCLDISGIKKSLKIYKINECCFDYRTSLFKRNNLDTTKMIILGGYIKLSKKMDFRACKEAGKKNIEYRQSRHPMEYPTLGSTFKNIPTKGVSKETLKKFENVIKKDPFSVIPVAAILDSIGLKGKRIGGMQFSEKHPNFLINIGKGTSKDALSLIKFVKNKVFSEYGIKIDPEIEVVK